METTRYEEWLRKNKARLREEYYGSLDDADFKQWCIEQFEEEGEEI